MSIFKKTVRVLQLSSTIKAFPMVILILLGLSGPARAGTSEIDQDLREFANIISEDKAGGYGWPADFQSVDFRTTEEGGKLKSIAMIKLSNDNETSRNLSLLIAGQTYGVVMTRGVVFENAFVVLATPGDNYSALLPLKQCRDMADAMLADPIDHNRIQDTILFFTAEVMNTTFVIQPE